MRPKKLKDMNKISCMSLVNTVSGIVTDRVASVIKKEGPGRCRKQVPVCTNLWKIP